MKKLNKTIRDKAVGIKTPFVATQHLDSASLCSCSSSGVQEGKVEVGMVNEINIQRHVARFRVEALENERRINWKRRFERGLSIIAMVLALTLLTLIIGHGWTI